MQSNNPKNRLEELLLSGKKTTLPKKHPVHHSENSKVMGYLQEGFVIRYMITSTGRSSVQSIYGPGDIFPLTPVFKAVFNYELYRGEEEFYYETIASSTIYSINKDTLIMALDEDPLLYKDLLLVAGQRLGSNINKLENVSLKAANHRVSHMLVYFAEKFGKETEGGIEITVPLTHELLSDTLDLARETVSLSLTRLAELKLIVRGKNIIVVDMGKLRSSIY